MHSCALGTTARIVLRSWSSATRSGPFTLARYASIVVGAAAVGVPRRVCGRRREYLSCANHLNETGRVTAVILWNHDAIRDPSSDDAHGLGIPCPAEPDRRQPWKRHITDEASTGTSFAERIAMRQPSFRVGLSPAAVIPISRPVIGQTTAPPATVAQASAPRLLDGVRGMLRTRHYSPRTERATSRGSAGSSFLTANGIPMSWVSPRSPASCTPSQPSGTSAR